MPFYCQDLKTRYEHLQRLTSEFTKRYSALKEGGDLREIKRLRIELEVTRDVLLEYVGIFTVPHAKNPYHEALLVAGLDPMETYKEQEMTLDIRKEIQRQLGVYQETKDNLGKPCLEEWVKDIGKNMGLIYGAMAKDREKIRERMKAGMIPVVMPGRGVQMNTWRVALSKLKPIWVQEGEQQVFDEAIVAVKQMTFDGFFQHIPDQPYLVWVRPSQEPDLKTRNQSEKEMEDVNPLERQQAYNADLVEEYPDLYDSTDIIPTEYAALQAIFTSHILARFKELRGEASVPIKIDPLDTKTAGTRFLSVGPFSNGGLPYANFRLGTRRLSFESSYPGGFGHYGFRPVSRSPRCVSPDPLIAYD